MKRLISFMLVLVLCVAPLSITASAAEVDNSKVETTSVQPRLNKTITLSLGNNWTLVWPENNWVDADLTVTNAASSSYDVLVRITSDDGLTVIKSEKTIAAGDSATFYDLPSGGYRIEAKSYDGEVREYTLKVKD